jgi:RNA polymerase sigma-70 factor (ECF subfamily)
MSFWGMKSGGSRRVQNVDRLTELYRAYPKLVWRTLRATGVRAADLDDVTHDVFLVVRRKLLTSNPVPFTPAMRPEDYERAWSAWLSRTAFFQANNYHRRAKRHRQDLMDNVDEFLDLRDETAQCEERDYLLQLLRNTTPERRTVFLLVEMEEYTVAEAASILEITVTTATKRLRQARHDIDEAAVTLKRRDETSRTPRRSGAFLLPFGVGAWVKLRVLLDPPAGTAERVWQRLKDSIAPIDEEPEGPSNSPPSQPPVPPPGSRPRAQGERLKSVLRHLLSASIGAAIAVWLLWPRAQAKIAVLQMPVPIPILTSSTQTPTSTVLNVADLPFVTSLASAAPPEQVLLDPEEVRMINQAHVALTGGDLAGTIAALNAYDTTFPEGQFKKDAQALRKRARPRR